MKTITKLLVVSALICSCFQPAAAQKTRSEKQAEKAAAVKKMVGDVNYVFKANYVNPMGGGGRALTDNYDLIVSKDTLTAFLPYFGRAYIAPMNPSEGGIKFTFTNFTYKAEENKKGGWDIYIKPKDHKLYDNRDVQSLRLSITSSGYASLNITSTNRDPISFSGYIEERE